MKVNSLFYLQLCFCFFGQICRLTLKLGYLLINGVKVVFADKVVNVELKPLESKINLNLVIP